MKPITDQSIVAELAETKKPIVIKFEAKWCAPCKAMTPVLLDIEKEYGDAFNSTPPTSSTAS